MEKVFFQKIENGKEEQGDEEKAELIYMKKKKINIIKIIESK